MSTPRPGVTGNFIVGAAVVVFLGLMAAVVAIPLAVEDGARGASLVAIVVPVGSTMLVTMLGLVATVLARNELREVKGHVEDLANGKMDAKVRAGVADVVKPEHIRDDVAEQLEADRARRDQHTPGASSA